MLLTLLTHQYSSLSPFSFLWGETTPVFTFLTQFMLWCFVGVPMSARRSRSWMASLCWQSLWQQFWQPTNSVALVYIVWGEVVANATTRKDPSVLLSSAGRCLWCSHSGKNPTEPSGDGVNLSQVQLVSGSFSFAVWRRWMKALRNIGCWFQRASRASLL